MIEEIIQDNNINIETINDCDYININLEFVLSNNSTGKNLDTVLKKLEHAINFMKEYTCKDCIHCYTPSNTDTEKQIGRCSHHLGAWIPKNTYCKNFQQKEEIE